MSDAMIVRAVLGGDSEALSTGYEHRSTMAPARNDRPEVVVEPTITHATDMENL